MIVTLALPLWVLAEGLGLGVPVGEPEGVGLAEFESLGCGDGDSPQCGYRNVHELSAATMPTLRIDRANFFMLFRLTLAAQNLGIARP